MRLAVGESKTNELVNSNLDDRERVWGELMRSNHKPTLEALAHILTGLGLSPDEFAKGKGKNEE